MPPEHTELCERILQGFGALFAAAEVGPHLPSLLRAIGLTSVSAELHGRLVWGGDHGDFGRLSLEHLRPRLVGAELVTEDEVARFLALTWQLKFGCLPLPLVSVRGQRPLE